MPQAFAEFGAAYSVGNITMNITATVIGANNQDHLKQRQLAFHSHEKNSDGCINEMPQLKWQVIRIPCSARQRHECSCCSCMCCFGRPSSPCATCYASGGHRMCCCVLKTATHIAVAAAAPVPDTSIPPAGSRFELAAHHPPSPDCALKQSLIAHEFKGGTIVQSPVPLGTRRHGSISSAAAHRGRPVGSCQGG